MNHDEPPRADTVPASFERRWRQRFEEFAGSHDDDAGIAGWSPSGLDTRFRFFRRVWVSPSCDGPSLDVGCGAGTYARWLAEQGIDVIGIDYSQPTLMKARARTPPEIALCAASASRLPFADASFGGAVCFGLLQAVPDSEAIATELARVLKPGGELWIDALNRSGLASRIDRTNRRLRGRGMHLRYEASRPLAAILERAGFDIVKRHWLPMLPSRLQALRPLIEARATIALLDAFPPAGALLSHSVVFHARRRAAG